MEAASTGEGGGPMGLHGAEGCVGDGAGRRRGRWRELVRGRTDGGVGLSKRDVGKKGHAGDDCRARGACWASRGIEVNEGEAGGVLQGEDA